MNAAGGGRPFAAGAFRALYWIQDLWMSGHTIDPKVDDKAHIPQPKPIPLVRCLNAVCYVCR
jgi:hypothetical protein